MGIHVRPRVVAPPWAQATLAGTRDVSVGREADVTPEAAPLARYRSVFPERWVAWDAARQLYAVWHTNPASGHEERLELVFDWDAPPAREADAPRTPDEVQALLAERRTDLLVRRFRDFDHAFVTQRLRERCEYLALGPARYAARIQAGNDRRERSARRDTVREMAAGLHEMRRWVPVLAEYQRTGNAGDALVHKPVLVPGATFAA